MFFAAVATVAADQDNRSQWPPFLPSRDEFGPDVVTAVERVWRDPTLVRHVHGRPAHVPFDFYIAFVDAPDVTAAAARHRKLARYEVEVIHDDWYQAVDHDGSRGLYRVIDRQGRRRIILSWGQNTGRFLGTVRGSALTVMDFEPARDEVDQQLTAYVLIDNSVAAALARVLVPVFGRLADRKLAEGFTVTATVAEWAQEQPKEFCQWLRDARVDPDHRARIQSLVPDCSDGAITRGANERVGQRGTGGPAIRPADRE